MRYVIKTQIGIQGKRERRIEKEFKKDSNWGIVKKRRCLELYVDEEDIKKLKKWRKKCNDARLYVKINVLLMWIYGWGVKEIIVVLGIGRATVYRIIKRYREEGSAGLVDKREDNGEQKVDEDYIEMLGELVKGSPIDFGFKRPRWTQELLVIAMHDRTRITVSTSTMCRALRKIKARRGRPRPIVKCPWSKKAKTRRINEIKKLIKNIKENEIVFWEDEVDIPLNPKIGWDWMMPGQQKEVITPGTNEKRYIAGVLNERDRRLTCVEGRNKNSTLFINLLRKVLELHAEAHKIYVILDNSRIHKSKQSFKFVEELEGKIELHFLPPYCPEENKIEREWKNLHDQVTRNHRCKDMEDLMTEVKNYVTSRLFSSYYFIIQDVA